MQSYLVYMEHVSWICCDPWSEWRSFYVWMTFCVACHSNNDKSLSGSYVKCFCEGVCGIIWSSPYVSVSYSDCDFDNGRNMTGIWTCYTCACPYDAA